MGKWFFDDEVFPIISQIIDAISDTKGFVDRDEIVESLLINPETKAIIDLAVKRDSAKPTHKKVAGSMIDWFSAEITTGSPRAAEWDERYERKRVKRQIVNSNGIRITRKVWAYAPAQAELIPEEVSAKEMFAEGALKRITVNTYERDRKARRKCIECYGAICFICKFDFGKFYGSGAEGVIHVHHLKSLSEIGERYEVDPKKDLIPVCPNCHAVLHICKEPAFTLEQVKVMVKQFGQR
jgi:predicted HNH restriction endonuclease